MEKWKRLLGHTVKLIPTSVHIIQKDRGAINKILKTWYPSYQNRICTEEELLFFTIYIYIIEQPLPMHLRVNSIIALKLLPEFSWGWV